MSDVIVQGGHRSSQGPVCIWQGMDLPMWVRFLSMRPPIDIKHLPRVALTTVIALHNSLAGFVERLVYQKSILSHEVKAPVFILGHWRSGTTLLHNLLSYDQQFVTTTLYRTLGFHHFLLTERFFKKLTAHLLPRTRPMDNMEITWDSPQEDEAILCNLCLLSPYLMAAFHSSDSVYNRFFDLQSLSQTELDAWKKSFVYLLKKISFAGDQRPLLKSPTHSFRIQTLLELFPKARFIHIVRNPYHVFASTIHMRKQMLCENSFSSPDFSRIEEQFFETYEALFERLESDVRLLNHDQFYELKYEDLESNIVLEMGKIYEHLALPGWSSVNERLQAKADALSKYRKNDFGKIDPHLMRKISERCRRVFVRYNYEF
jgi:hypothetical protein